MGPRLREFAPRPEGKRHGITQPGPAFFTIPVLVNTYLNLGVGLLGVEADADGEEVVGVAAARELHAARLVGRVYHRKLK